MLFMLIVVNITAQNTALDSLLSISIESLNDSVQANTLNKIGYEYYTINIDSTAYYAQKALKISEANNFRKDESRALNLLGIVAQFKGDFNQALTLNTRAYNIGEELNSISNITSSSNELSIIYEQINDIEQSIHFAMIALDGARKMKDTLFTGFMLSNLAKCHLEVGNFSKAHLYKDEIIDLAKISNNCELLTEGHFISGKLQFEEKNLVSSLNSYNQSIEEAEKCNDQYFVSFSFIGVSEVHYQNGDFLLAKKFIDKANDIFEKTGDLDSHGENYLLESDILFSLGQNPEAVAALMSGLAYAQKNQNLDFEKKYLDRLSKYNKEKGDFKNAIYYSEQSNEVQKKLSDQNKAVVMLELERKYNIEKKDVELQLLQEQNSKDAQIIKSRSYFILASTLFALLVGVIAWFTWLNLRKEAKHNAQLETKVTARTQELQQSNEMLHTSNQELERFAYISSHDLKEPLKNMISFTKLIKKEATKLELPKISEYSDILENCSYQLNTLVSDILDYSMVKSDLKIQNVDLNSIVDQLQSDLKDTIKSKNAIIASDKLPNIKSDKSKMYQAFKNIIENGIKYNKSEVPQVKISSEELAASWKIKFQDNGVGIDPKYHEQIFVMFKRLHNRDEFPGSGIGLSAAKTIIDKLNGAISVQSFENQGSQFTIILPKL